MKKISYILTHVYEPTINPCIASLIDTKRKNNYNIIVFKIKIDIHVFGYR